MCHCAANLEQCTIGHKFPLRRMHVTSVDNVYFTLQRLDERAKEFADIWVVGMFGTKVSCAIKDFGEAAKNGVRVLALPFCVENSAML